MATKSQNQKPKHAIFTLIARSVQKGRGELSPNVSPIDAWATVLKLPVAWCVLLCFNVPLKVKDCAQAVKRNYGIRYWRARRHTGNLPAIKAISTTGSTARIL